MVNIALNQNFLFRNHVYLKLKYFSNDLITAIIILCTLIEKIWYNKILNKLHVNFLNL